MKQLFLLFIVLIALAGVVYLYSQDFFRPPTPPERPFIIAHRGASGEAPENTLIAIRKAMEQEADFIEVDLHMTRDGELVVIHDDRLERTTNGTGMVKDQLLPDLKALDAGSWFGKEFTGEAIPTLGEVMDLINGRCYLLLELKKHGLGYYTGMVRVVLDQLYERKAENWVILQSFHNPILEELALLDPEMTAHKLLHIDLPILPLYEDGEWNMHNIFEYPSVYSLNPAYQYLQPRFVNKAHREGYQVFVYTVNETQDMRRMTKMGVDGIITDFPGRAIRMQREGE
ncbi:MAG: glycerophosphodiester phosphodiesterase family protein [Bacteroidota bacterium]